MVPEQPFTTPNTLMVLLMTTATRITPNNDPPASPNIWLKAEIVLLLLKSMIVPLETPLWPLLL